AVRLEAKALAVRRPPRAQIIVTPGAERLRRHRWRAPRLEHVNVVVLVAAPDDREALAVRRPLRIEIGLLAGSQPGRGPRGEVERIHVALAAAAGDERDPVMRRRPVPVPVLLLVARDAGDAAVRFAQV